MACLGAGGATVAGAFPGVNGAIVYTRGTDGQYGIYRANADGSGAVQLFSGGQSPAVSADGKRIAFEAVGSGLYVMDSDGRHPMRVTPPVPGSSDANPSWSPKGDRIAFTSSRPAGRSWQVWVVGVDGRGLTELTSDWGVQPAWSPDGSKIAFMSADLTHPGSDFIAVMNSDGSGSHRLTLAGGGPEGSPAWSPDGKKIVFGRYAADWQTTNERPLYVIGADGSGERQLTHGGFYDDNPSWSPDGTRIVFQRQKGQQLDPELYTIEADGSDVKPLITSPEWNFAPDWAVGASAPTGPTAPAVLNGAVGPGRAIALTRSDRAVSRLAPGKYELSIRDNSTEAGYILTGPGAAVRRLTSAHFVGVKKVTITLVKGRYWYHATPREPRTTSHTFTVG